MRSRRQDAPKIWVPTRNNSAGDRASADDTAAAQRARAAGDAKQADRLLAAARAARRKGQFRDCVAKAERAWQVRWPLAAAPWEAAECSHLAGDELAANRFAGLAFTDAKEQKLAVQWSSFGAPRRTTRVAWTKQGKLLLIEALGKGSRAWQLDPSGDWSEWELVPRSMHWVDFADQHTEPGRWNPGVSSLACRSLSAAADKPHKMELWKLDEDRLLWETAVPADQPHLGCSTPTTLSPDGRELLGAPEASRKLLRWRMSDGTSLPGIEFLPNGAFDVTAARGANWIAVAVEPDFHVVQAGVFVADYPFQGAKPRVRAVSVEAVNGAT
jgi:hypothetical protein